MRAWPSRRGACGVLLRRMPNRMPHRIFNGLWRTRLRVSEVSLLQRHEVTLLQALGLAQLLLILRSIALRGRLRAQKLRVRLRSSHRLAVFLVLPGKR